MPDRVLPTEVWEYHLTFVNDVPAALRDIAFWLDKRDIALLSVIVTSDDLLQAVFDVNDEQANAEASKQAKTRFVQDGTQPKREPLA
jgi:hypothetical protein